MRRLTETVIPLPFRSQQWHWWLLQLTCLFLVSDGINTVGQGYGEYYYAILSSNARGYGFECHGKYMGASSCEPRPAIHSSPHMLCRG